MTRIGVGRGLWTNPSVGFILERAHVTEAGLWAVQVCVSADTANAVYVMFGPDPNGNPAYFAQNLWVPAGDSRVYPLTIWIEAGEYILVAQNLASWIGKASVSIVGVKLPERSL